MSQKKYDLPPYLIAAQDLRDNPEQMEVFNSKEHCIVLAGPGSGKTKTLTIKIAQMLHEDIEEPQGLACITYNKECARELKRRLNRLGIYESKRVFIDTVHSFCLNNVIKPFAKLAGLQIPEPIKVATVEQQNKLWEKAFNLTIGLREPITGRWKTNATVYRRTYLDRNSSDWKIKDKDLSVWIEDYESLLRKEGLIDFDDMVLLGLDLIEKNEWIRNILKAKFPVLVVDEYQDLGLPLHKIVQNLCFKSQIRLLAVGDPDQSIYGFTGANPRLLKELSIMDNVISIHLKFNYRSSKKIVDASQITLGEDRGYQTINEDNFGIIDFYEYDDGLEEQAEKICTEIIPSILKRNPSSKIGDIAILYVDKNDGDVIAEKIAYHKMNYIRIDQNAPYSKTPLNRWLEDCAAWCNAGWRIGEPKLSDLIRTWLSFFDNTITNDKQLLFLKRQFVEFLWENKTPDVKLFEWLKAFYLKCLKQMFEINTDLTDDDKLSFRKLVKESNDGRIANFTVASFAGQGGSPEHINLITLHSAKGLEFTYVIMMGMEQGRIPNERATAVGKSEARRLFYVGFTRAKQEVHLTYSGWYSYYGRKKIYGPSEYLLEIQDQLEH